MSGTNWLRVMYVSILLGVFLYQSMGEHRSFQFTYGYPPPGNRFWQQVSANTWQERYPDGQVTPFHVIGRITVDGVAGTVVRRDPDESLDVLIPDDLSIGAWIRFQVPGQLAWQLLAQVHD